MGVGVRGFQLGGLGEGARGFRPGQGVRGFCRVVGAVPGEPRAPSPAPSPAPYAQPPSTAPRAPSRSTVAPFSRSATPSAVRLELIVSGVAFGP